MNVCPAPTDRDETHEEFFKRICNPATPHFDKISAWAKAWKEAEMQERRDEEAAHERRMADRQDEMLSAIRADREAA